MAKAIIGGLTVLACLFSTAAVAQAGPPSGERHHVGLIIGNSSYAPGTDTSSGRLPRLNNACSDAQRVAAGLVRIGWKEDQEVDLQCNLTTDQMAAHVRAFTQRINEDPYAVAVFYFAGHGVQVDDRQFIFGVDAKLNLKAAAQQIDRNPNSRLFTTAALDVYADLVQFVGAVTDGGLTVIIDACRSDPIIAAINSEGVRRVTAPTVKTVILPGILLALSTQKGESAMDGGGANGPYALALESSFARDKDVSRIIGAANTKVWTETSKRFPSHPQIPTMAGFTSFPCLAGCIDGAKSAQVIAPAFRRTAALLPNSSVSSARAMMRTASMTQPSAMALPPALTTNLFARSALSTMRQASGLRAEIFWCTAGENAFARRALAERFGSLLSEEARKHPEKLASVKLRSLSREGNSLPNYRLTTNSISFSPTDENAKKWATLAEESGIAELSVAPTGKSKDYLAIFVCEQPLLAGSPARVFWQVPAPQQVGFATNLMKKLDEKAGNFHSQPSVEAVLSSPDTTQVRYYMDADQKLAFGLADSLQLLLQHRVPVKFLGLQPGVSPGTLEVWIGKEEGGSRLGAVGELDLASAPSRNQLVLQH